MLDTTEYQPPVEASNGTIRARQPVETPLPDGERVEGYKYYYRGDGHYYRIHRVTDLGWSVWRYTIDEEEGGPTPEYREDSRLSAQEAHRLAQQLAIEAQEDADD